MILRIFKRLCAWFVLISEYGYQWKLSKKAFWSLITPQAFISQIYLACSHIPTHTQFFWMQKRKESDHIKCFNSNTV